MDKMLGIIHELERQIEELEIQSSLSSLTSEELAYNNGQILGLKTAIDLIQ